MKTSTNQMSQGTKSTDWLGNIKALDDETWFHNPSIIRPKIPSVERVLKLVDVLNPAERDAASYALIELLSAVQILFTNHDANEKLEVEKMVWTAIDRAYLYTSHYRLSLNKCVADSAQCAEWEKVEQISKFEQKQKGEGIR